MKSQILEIYDSILTAPLLYQIGRSDQEKLSNLTKKPKERKFFLKLIQQQLNKSQQVFIRLKVLCLLQSLISNQFQEENIEFINSIITAHEKRVLKSCQKISDISEMSDYFQSQVQLPYTIFLRKMVFWQDHEESKENFDINLGFSLINRLKEIIQLKKIFHNYGCYYPTHKYAINMFKETLSAVNKLWNEICFMVKTITVFAIQTNTILEEEFLFICSAEEIQECLIEYLYGGYFSKNIGKDQKIKMVQLLKPQICQLEIERKKKINEDIANECLRSKRQSHKSGQKNYLKKTGDSQSVEEKLTTQMEVQILDSILRLQSLISQ